MSKKRDLATMEEEEEEEDKGLQSVSEDEVKRERKISKKKRQRLQEETEKAKNKGVCYLSRIPPKMDHVQLRQHLSRLTDTEILRIYLAPENPEAQVRRKKAGGFRGTEYCEGWVEFANKHKAKRLAKDINDKEIGGKKRSKFYYDRWNIKYLSKFKWDDLTQETAHRNAVREQKLHMELSAANKEKNFYLTKVEQSNARKQIEERFKKKQKIEELENPRVIRHFPQKKSLADSSDNSKPKLSKDVLAEVFKSSIND